MPETSASCRVCGSNAVTLVKASDISHPLASDDFAITDASYGRTAAIYQCGQCGFMQCQDLADVLPYYQALHDPAYEEGRAPRRHQALELLRTTLASFGRAAAGLRLLDVGAGSGILVDAATGLGCNAEGIEPSAWLADAAAHHGCRVHQGVLPHPAVTGPFDLITVVDVIEHVSDPLGLVKTIVPLMAEDGVVAIITPDVRSLAARVLRWRWWHFRVAHVGYFDPATLRMLCERAGLQVLAMHRPGWYFTVAYLRERLGKYLPDWLVPPPAAWMERCTVPLNLGDSLLVVCRRAH